MACSGDVPPSRGVEGAFGRGPRDAPRRSRSWQMGGAWRRAGGDSLSVPARTASVVPWLVVSGTGQGRGPLEPSESLLVGREVRSDESTGGVG